MKQIIKRIADGLTDILYPRRCPICGEIPGQRGSLICPGCAQQVRPLEEPLCKKCGKPLADEAEEFCPDCRRGNHIYTRGYAALPYTGQIRQSVYQIKYHNKREYLDYYGPLMAQALEARIRPWQADFLVPVPLHRSRRRKRGFNQAEILARHVGKQLGISVRTDLVRRTRATRPQKELGYRERQNNLKGAFKIGSDDVKLKKIILVDDIYTTGSTVDAIAGELLAHGAGEVYFISLCIGRDS